MADMTRQDMPCVCLPHHVEQHHCCHMSCVKYFGLLFSNQAPVMPHLPTELGQFDTVTPHGTFCILLSLAQAIRARQYEEEQEAQQGRAGGAKQCMAVVASCAFNWHSYCIHADLNSLWHIRIKQ